MVLLQSWLQELQSNSLIKGCMKVNGRLLPLSLFFFGICIVIASVFVSDALRDIAYNRPLPDSVNIEQNNPHWEVVVVDQNHLILFNHYTGQYYTRFLTDEDWTIDWKQFGVPN